jgi:hypothetical protein
VEEDRTWSAVLALCEELAPVEVRRSRFAPKPAIFLGRREFAHWEGPGRVDLRVTSKAWRGLAAEFGGDPAVEHDPGRRDWVDLELRSDEDVHRLRPLFAAAVRANAD